MHLRPAVALAACLLAGTAALAPSIARAADDESSGLIQMAYTVGATKIDSNSWWPLGVQLAVGWRVNRNLALEVLAAAPLVVQRSSAGDSGFEFERLVGVRAVGYLPLQDRWDAMGAAGAVSTRDFATGAEKSEALVSAGVLYHSSRHLSYGLEASMTSSTHVPIIGVRSEWQF